MKNITVASWIKLLFCMCILISCEDQNAEITQQSSSNQENEVRENTKRLLSEFLIKEDLEQVRAMLHDSIKFHWPNKTVVNINGLMEACKQVIDNNDNEAELIDIIVEDNRSYILFIWSGVVEVNDNEKIIGKEFSVHDCWTLTWENGKIVDWYTVWGSRTLLVQLGYKITPP